MCVPWSWLAFAWFYSDDYNNLVYQKFSWKYAKTSTRSLALIVHGEHVAVHFEPEVHPSPDCCLILGIFVTAQKYVDWETFRRFPPPVLVHACLVTKCLGKEVMNAAQNKIFPFNFTFSPILLSSVVSHYEDGRRGSNEGSADRDSLRSCTYCCRPASRVWAQTHGGPGARSPTQSGQECRVVIRQCLPDPHPHQAGQRVNNHAVSLCPKKPHQNNKT